ncbi:glycosyltransferase, partial [Deinococcus pimensis]|uniref:glycosyltransferase n=1 Tax=Deinococcus pimensis TaxID=309888 RepID=UPI0004897A9F
MRAAIVALGSRGDVQPYVALGRALRAEGHDVRLVTHENFAELVQGAGLDFRSVRGDVQAAVRDDEMRALLARGDMLALNRRSAQLMREAAPLWAEDGLAATRDVDVLLAGIGGLNLARALSEKLNVPLVEAHVVPFTPTRAFPGALFPGGLARLGGSVNLLTHELTRQVMWQAFRTVDADMRRVLGLPRAPLFGPRPTRASVTPPVLYGISPAVIPPPADWAGHAHVTGYWFLDTDGDWTPPGELTDFLDAGPAPVCVGFGSMALPRPDETSGIVLDALGRAGRRAVLLSGWGGVRAESSDDVY